MAEALLIDCDGVLVDSEKPSHGVLQQTLAELGVALSFDATMERFIGTSLPVCMTRARRRSAVQDTPSGISAAKAAGMRAIGFAAMTPRARLAAAGADALADSMDELAALLAAS